MELAPAEKFLLANESHKYHYIVKENVFLALGREVASEIIDFQLKKPEFFVSTAVGRDENRVVASEFRGDLRCWLNPKLCSEQGLHSTLQLVKNLISSTKQLKTPLQLNGDYSIQVTKYVRAIPNVLKSISDLLL
jgi:hypothetical protein